ncbi:MAG TPA: MauE/DoxX family redox-associated membrane protein [Streptosporangiaceae bacterium]|nr:MauE/DoxX family redox-associated membrane protein [Streptosporangiaceae bacterium]
MLLALGYVQIPLLAAMLLGGCAAKAARAARFRSINAALGPTALFPLRLRRWAAILLCAVEFGFGVGLILTAGPYGAGRPAELIRFGTCLLFLVAICTLVELRNARPDIGCGCFGEFSTAPITGRTLARAALLAVAAFASIKVPPIKLPHTAASDARILLLLIGEFVLFGLLSPEIRDVLVRIGYSAPCELRVASPEQTLAALQRSAQWRKHSGLIASPEPADMWRELCWRYVAFSSRHAGREVELVFAVYLQSYRPPVLSVLVDTATGEVLPWPVGAPGSVPAWRSKTGSQLGPVTTRLARGLIRPQADPADRPESAIR